MIPKEPIRDLLAALDGARILGGCDDCNAYQTLEIVSPGVTVLAVHHDDTCPWWTDHQNGGTP